MWSSIVFSSFISGQPIDLNTLEYPLHNLEITPTMRGGKRSKTQRPGQWAGRNLPDELLISMEGDIVGNPTNSYVVLRQNLKECITVRPTYTDFLHGRLYFTPDIPSPPLWYCDVVVESEDMPMEALYPNISPFRLAFRSPDPYLRNYATDAIVYF